MERVALLNIGHHGRSPRCARAAVRILGLFPSHAEALAHAGTLGDMDVDICAAPVGSFVVLMREAGADEAAHLAALLRAHERVRELGAADFEANRLAQRAGAVRPAAPKAEVPAEAGEPPSAVGRTREVRMQRFAVVSFLPDVDEPREAFKQPGFCVYEAFDTEDEARRHIKDRLGVRVRDVDLSVVAMYEWLFPTNEDMTKVDEEYRVAELTEIIRTWKEQPHRVEAFRRECEKEGLSPPLISIGPPVGS